MSNCCRKRPYVCHHWFEIKCVKNLSVWILCKTMTLLSHCPYILIIFVTIFTSSCLECILSNVLLKANFVEYSHELVHISQRKQNILTTSVHRCLKVGKILSFWILLLFPLCLENLSALFNNNEQILEHKNHQLWL